MAKENIAPEQEEEQNSQLESGTYEVIKGRLNRYGKELRGRLDELNLARKEIFGAIELELKGNSRINTENNCVARDIIAVGDFCIFGYNVQMGLRSEIKLEDIFSAYQFNGDHFEESDLSPLFEGQNRQFLTDFSNLFRYYKDAVFAKFAIEQNSPFFYMVFQLSEDVNDSKMFKWEVRDGQLLYFNQPGEHRYKFPAQHEFEWKKVSREMYRYGDHPHISILDRVFVETVGGDLTIKVEDNTADGQGIYQEEVAQKDQKLEDADIQFANLGNLIVLRMAPYLEDARYFVFNEKLQSVERIDTLEHSGILLPGSQGLIFANGFYLQTGDYKVFDKAGGSGYKFERRVQSPNGEDHLFSFYNQQKGTYILLSYNVIEQQVATPIHCHGYTLFPNGELCYFRAEESATKHHMIQIWQTPYIEGDIIPSEHTDSFLYKVGNRDIVRAMAECQELLSLLGKDETYSDLYFDLTKKSNDILDAYYWIKDPQAFGIDAPLGEIRQAANAAIDEFEKVQSIKKASKESIQEVGQRANTLFKEVDQASFNQIGIFVNFLSELRIIRGEIISLKDLRYADLPYIEGLEAQAAEKLALLSTECVAFLLRPDALEPYMQKVAEAKKEIPDVETAQQGKKLEERIDGIGKELEMLIEIVSNLKIEDATQTTRIIDSITDIFSLLNQIKAALRRRLKELTSAEGQAEFAAQMKLIDQSIINYIDISDTPSKCDEYLSKLMIQVEELESKFAEFDEFILKISEKREEVYNVFETKKLSLVEAINRRSSALQTAAERILKGVRNRANKLKSVVEINGFFASDLMIDKLRESIEQLRELGDSNKAGDLQTQLKTIQEDALRQLRDKEDLFEGGGNAIRFGRHSFAVNTQSLDLTMVPRSGGMYYHLTGTGFFQEVEDPEFLATKSVWDQSYPSENAQVYRAEFLAYLVLKELEAEQNWLKEDEILPYVQKFMASRYQDGYNKGIQDEDAAQILGSLLYLHQHIDHLSFGPESRVLAQLYYLRHLEEEERQLLDKQLRSAGQLLKLFPKSKEFDRLLEDLEADIQDYLAQTALFAPHLAAQAARYLLKERAKRNYFLISGQAHDLKQAFLALLEGEAMQKDFEQAIRELDEFPKQQFELLRQWLNAFCDSQEQPKAYLDEAALILLLGQYQDSQVLQVNTQQELLGLRGEHSNIGENGRYFLDYNRFMDKMQAYMAQDLPLYERFVQMKKDLTHEFKEQLRLSEFKPRVLSSFVRNKLIDQLYLPIFGDNLAKQIGTLGEGSRTDRMGMLLLISPPGYGKTTLMEYVANRLGLIFMKINGPAIGHDVVSLDPSEAKNAGARKELEKLNLSLEMGDNVMIYLDDIQHCHPEFLQKFISLTDGQRKIEGVYQGQTKTYDLRGKRVSVVMAGNPYTESGDKFRIPDMLANRADIYNLGDIIGKTKDIFELSYIENSLTSNPVTQKLAAKSIDDLYPILEFAQTGRREGLEFRANHSPQELNEYAAVLKKMLRIRDVILKVNQGYIKSAAMPDAYRTEPPFLLQGSYRNMNKLAEKVVAVMNEEEIETLLVSHYKGESQTLTSSAEANMLKLKEMMGLQTEEERKRWEAVKAAYVKDRLLQGDEQNPMVQMVAQLSNFSDQLGHIQKAILKGIEEAAKRPVEAPSKRTAGPSFKKR